MAKNKKKKSKVPVSDLMTMLIGSGVITLLFIGSLVLSIKYIKEFEDSKSYISTTAYIVGDVDIRRNTTEDKYGNVVSESKYYYYTYAFKVDGKEYTGREENTEKYYGDYFEVFYNPENPNQFVVADEAKFPIVLCLVTLALATLDAVGIIQFIKEQLP